jgi:hypothetical protein
VVAVAATNDRDALARFSNFGDRTVLLGAPGVRVRSTFPPSSYAFLDGTSMAGPHVAGVAALLKAKNNRWNWAKIRNRIVAGGDSKSSLAGKTITGERLNARGAATCRGRPFFGVLRPLDTQSGQAIPIAALNINCAKPVTTPALTVTITPGGSTLNLLDDGAAPDLAAKDGIFSAAWAPNPCVPRVYTFSFSNGKSVQSNVTC